jgi:secreted PhoX family phosphatase
MIARAPALISCAGNAGKNFRSLYMSDHDDLVTNTSNNPEMSAIIARRAVLKGGAGLAAASLFGALAGCGDSENPLTVSTATAASSSTAGYTAPTRATALGFSAVAKSVSDAISLPPGYYATVLLRLGDPIKAGVPFYRNDGSDAGASYDARIGDHSDTIEYYGLGADGRYSATASDRALLVMNHEAITPVFLHRTGPTIVNGARTVAEEVLKEFYVHGVSITEVVKQNGEWTYKQDSSFNRRVHTLTEMELSGPARGSAFMITKYSKDGTRTRGTVNDCAHGYTPWGTYLACEENWAGYFRRTTATDNPRRTAKELTSMARYGVAGAGRELWATVTPDTSDDLYGRWNAEVRGATAADDYRNGPNTYGWNVEIDPFTPSSVPKKRTAMGRFAHEGAWVAKAEAGKPIVFYMGCDSRNEYIYKYVSTALWDPADASRGLAAGDKYLDNGKLYTAIFEADGTGRWVELTFNVGAVNSGNTRYSFANQADVLINARLAADVSGATKMDRPEWGAVDPNTGAVYMTLTNNNATLRTLASTDAANPRHYNDARTNGTAQRGNPNGHIIRWQESTPAALTFRWDVYLFGARSTANAANVNLSGLTAENDFSSPDGLWFSRNGICWIQTDDGAFTDVTNCMLLAAIPGTVGDGGPRTITNTDASGATRQQTTFVGAQPGTAKLRRFLVGPVECEITGITESPDGRSLFVNIQHPGEDTAAANIGDPTKYSSHWPDGGLARPRSATIVIQRTDGGVIGV